MDLTNFRTLGRSGLAVSPLALGTMTFGAGRWGADQAGSRAIFDAYAEAGGNFIDTADVYSGGESEAMIGRFLRERGGRDRMVIATKSGFSRGEGNPLSGGNSARNIRDGLEGVLRRLGSGHIDMYWTHVWDRTTPAEEVLRADRRGAAWRHPLLRLLQRARLVCRADRDTGACPRAARADRIAV